VPFHWLLGSVYLGVLPAYLDAECRSFCVQQFIGQLGRNTCNGYSVHPFLKQGVGAPMEYGG
jgi:hypothetical protein